jgi:hypothetical protein
MKLASERQELATNAVAALPKADIHLHAETRARVDRLISLREGRIPYDWPFWVRKLREMPAGMARLEAIKGELEVTELERLAKDNFVEWVADAMRAGARDDAVVVEMRFGADWVKWPDLMPKFRDAERQVQSEYPAFCAEAVISGVSPARPNGKDVIDTCLEVRKAGLAGIDFFPIPYDREADWAQWEEVYSWAEQAAGAGLGITVHAGEFSPANIRSALGVPGVTRIGHAVHAAFDTALLDELGESGVTVECCLTSNVVLGAVPSLEEHPIRSLVDAGIPLTLSSDDPVSLDTTIGTEYELAAGLEFDASDLLRFTRNGISASFTSAERKTALLSLVGQHDVPGFSGTD